IWWCTAFSISPVTITKKLGMPVSWRRSRPACSPASASPTPMRRVPIRGQAKQLKLRAMPADSDTKSAPVPSASTSLQIEPADGRAAAIPAPRPLLGEIAARLAQALRGLRKDSAMRESLEEVIEESERETQDLSSQERLRLANLLTFGE